MPIATANVVEEVRVDLKSAPPDGFVVLRRLTFGQMVERREMMKLSVSGKGGKDFQGEMAMASAAMVRWEFARSVIDHNLEDATGRKLNLAVPVDFASLDPRVGEEIETKISELNNFEEKEEELGN